MKYGKTILFAVMAGIVIGLFISVMTTSLVLLLGLLFVPPAAALISTINEGIPVLMKEYVMPGKNYYVVYPAASKIELES